MPELTNPYTGRPVNVHEDHVDRLVSAGFTPVRAAAAKPEPTEEPKPTPRRGRPRKSE